MVESGRDTLNTTDNLYIRVFPYPTRVAWFAAHGMPEATQIDQLAATEPRPAHGAPKTVFPDLTSHEFAHLDTWINDHGATTYTLWIIEHPWLVVLEPFRRPERSFNNAGGNINGYAAGNRVTSGLTPVLWPPWVWLLGVAAVVVVVLEERDLEVNRVVQAVVGLGLLGIVAMFAAWSGDGQETTRHTLEGLAEVHLGVLIMLLYVTLTRVPARNETSHPEPTADLLPASELHELICPERVHFLVPPLDALSSRLVHFAPLWSEAVELTEVRMRVSGREAPPLVLRCRQRVQAGTRLLHAQATTGSPQCPVVACPSHACEMGGEPHIHG